MNQEALSIAVKAVQIYAEKHPRPLLIRWKSRSLSYLAQERCG